MTRFWLKCIAIAFCATVTAACAHRILGNDDYSIESRDVIADKRFEIELKNRSNSTICFSSQGWPTPSGHMPSNPETYVELDGMKIPMKLTWDEDFGSIRVKKGASLKGFLTYSNFDLPESKIASKKTLHFDFNASRC